MEKTWLNKNKKTIKIIIVSFVLALFLGIYIYLSQNNNIKSGINEELTTITSIIKENHQNNIIKHILLISTLIVLSFTIIGLPIIFVYYMYEGISLGFLLSSFYKYKKLNGIIFTLGYTIINKLIFYLLLVYLLISTINYTKNITKKNGNHQEIILNQLYKSIFMFIILVLTDVFIYFFGNKIISFFLFLL